MDVSAQIYASAAVPLEIYPLPSERGLGGRQSRSGNYGEENTSCLTGNRTSDPPVISSFTNPKTPLRPANFFNISISSNRSNNTQLERVNYSFNKKYSTVTLMNENLAY
jgi:hypothetical protein